MTWRDKFRPVISRVLKEHEGQSDAEIRKALREAWPKGEPRAYWPYRVWLDEIARQRGRKPPTKRKVQKMTAKEAREWMAARQRSLW